MINFEMYHDIIEALTAALDAKDVYTAGHSTRVGNMAYDLGKKLSLDNSNLQILHIAGHLHDIGKIGVSDNVLNKKGKLDLNEWEQMKMHPEIGYNILKKTKSLKEISHIVLHHHERWDGSGYPSKLSKEQIPLGSRIIAICDSIDAMRSNRPYKQLISNIECYNEILQNSGIMYDPKIADCIIENWNTIVVPYYL
ncbi:HD-GYP domain-containing protein [Clostridium saccharobutylicum]|uniref:Cyclic di-GMP phosphodiesterase response regulator RpfG n=1 Tax=Clostridium saccharobutylicum DSM 13864 TaxID=1345695 RepID=U5MPE5_CLOSA|nr:HD-GYP domain-containing protein [Clostridium saccharobutylicum]AGX42679.1 cyclic di-GMP phosphodiesterase response regulator RpfG [Clostridium saccharobutylicum DSM 13864]MBA2904733.1 HD-GYP domain-containing protein (c-di-GMP phosphodiesterase class II) [Clostridium saccharobutylicum]MBA8789311.1 HD-GYP domain-containing protein (c-di-GMP phosphodiesterase class II) [Clostridium saccharobutylicum]MBA8896002.1 HD-GYP domain-containing protein (c-di-GMP phosphodiesterase class II) [Clostridi